MKYIYINLLLIIIFSCCQNGKNNLTDKYQKSRKLTENIQINEINTNVNFRESEVFVIRDILIVFDSRNIERGLHLFNKNTFNYICSTGIVGKGPSEIAMVGFATIDNKSDNIWLSDYGKLVIWKFPLDSILNNSNFKPTINVPLNGGVMMEKYRFLNDSIIIGKAVKAIPNSRPVEVSAKLNINNDSIMEFGYSNPELDKSQSKSFFAISNEKQFYVNCYREYDLITICNIDGNVKYNIYGPNWGKNDKFLRSFFRQVEIFGDYIIATYDGDEKLYFDEFQRRKVHLPSRFQIFNQAGYYIKTIETNKSIVSFTIDEENRRIIACFEDSEILLGYFDLKLN